MMVRLFSRDAVAKSPCTCGSLPGIYTMFVAELFEQSENAIFDIILADITNHYSIWRRNMVALCKIRT